MKIFVGMPVIHDIKVECFRGLKESGLLDNVSLSQGHTAGKSRNALVKEFLASDCTHLLFIDSDVRVPGNILDLLRHNQPIIAPLSFGVTADLHIVPKEKHNMGKMYISSTL